MKLFAIYTLIVLASSCGNTSQTELSTAIAKDGISESESTQSLDTKSKCTDTLYEELGMPSFGFLYRGKKAFSKEFLVDTLFSEFIVQEVSAVHGSDQNAKEIGSLRIVQYHNSKQNTSPLGQRENEFNFIQNDAGLYTLANADLNFSATSYELELNQLYAIEKNDAIIDIGMDKNGFADLFSLSGARLCDTVKVGDDSSDSWYVFENDGLSRILINQYVN